MRPLEAGNDQHYREIKVVTIYDKSQVNRLASGTRGDCEAAGRMTRREAGRVRLDTAVEKVGNVDRSPNGSGTFCKCSSTMATRRRGSGSRNGGSG